MRKKYFGEKQGPKMGNELHMGAGPPVSPGGKPFDADEPNLNPSKAKSAKPGSYSRQKVRGGGAATKGLDYEVC